MTHAPSPCLLDVPLEVSASAIRQEERIEGQEEDLLFAVQSDRRKE